MAVPDATRAIDVSAALKALTPCLLGEHRVIIGLGLHRRMTATELLSLKAWHPHQHDPDDCGELFINGRVIGGVSKLILAADWSISVGVVELHQYAGYSGGHKGVSVGCGARETISELHSRASILRPGVGVGQLENNPFRAQLEELGEAARCRLALVYVPAAQRWLFGEPKTVVRVAAKLIHPWEHWHAPVDTLRVCVPESKSRSLYQASRAATYLSLSPNPVLREGGTIALTATLSEGLGSEAGFVNALRDCRPPWSRLLTEAEPRGAGAQRAVVLALMARRHRLVLYGCAEPALFSALGIEAHSEPADPSWPVVVNPFHRLPQLR